MRLALLALVMLAAPAYAQNSFPTPGKATVPGVVLMCLNASAQSIPCPSPGGIQTIVMQNSFPTPSGAVARGAHRMCIINRAAVAC